MQTGEMTPQDLGRKWVPKNADELSDAYRDGLLDEAHWCDLKKEITTNNKETARDLASFSVDGGTIFVGLDEDLPDGSPLNAVELQGLAERIERIALSSVHPSLQIVCTPIGSGKDDGKGYLVVHIPASALAPHQVDGVYYGRGDKTKRRLPEPEVERLYQRRAQWNRDAGDMLAGYMAAEPEAEAVPRLFMVARPVGASPEMCTDLVSGKDWRTKLAQLKFNISQEESLARVLNELGMRSGENWINHNNMPALEKTDRGALLSNRMLPGQSAQGRDRRLEISEDGEMRLSFNYIHDTWNINGVEKTALNLVAVVLITREMQAVARYLSGRCGHSSMWDFGLGLDGLAGIRPLFNMGYPQHAADHFGYPGMDYQQTTRASVLDLEKAPGAVAQRLAGKLYRTFDVNDEKFLTVFKDEIGEQG
jgi:hypothetical protein